MGNNAKNGICGICRQETKFKQWCHVIPRCLMKEKKQNPRINGRFLYSYEDSSGIQSGPNFSQKTWVVIFFALTAKKSLEKMMPLQRSFSLKKMKNLKLKKESFYKNLPVFKPFRNQVKGGKIKTKIKTFKDPNFSLYRFILSVVLRFNGYLKVCEGEDFLGDYFDMFYSGYKNSSLSQGKIRIETELIYNYDEDKKTTLKITSIELQENYMILVLLGFRFLVSLRVSDSPYPKDLKVLGASKIFHVICSHEYYDLDYQKTAYSQLHASNKKVKEMVNKLTGSL